MDSGFCKIEYTPEQAQQVIDFRQRLLREQEECQWRITNGDFNVAQKHSILFFSWVSTYFDSELCQNAYKDLFDYCTIFDCDDAPGVYTTKSFAVLSSMARLLKTKGDVYLTPEQCTIFRRIVDKEIA